MQLFWHRQGAFQNGDLGIGDQFRRSFFEVGKLLL